MSRECQKYPRSIHYRPLPPGQRNGEVGRKRVIPKPRGRQRLLHATAGRLKGRGISSSTTLCAPWTGCVPEPSGSIGSRMTIRLDPLLRCPKGPVAPIPSPPAARRERECAAKPEEGERSPCLPG